MRHTPKRLLAVLTSMAGVPLLMVAGATSDLVIRALTIIAGACLIISGGIQFWMLRRRRRHWGSDIPY
jgi:hypothetical protein